MAQRNHTRDTKTRVATLSGTHVDEPAVIILWLGPRRLNSTTMDSLLNNTLYPCLRLPIIQRLQVHLRSNRYPYRIKDILGNLTWSDRITTILSAPMLGVINPDIEASLNVRVEENYIISKLDG